MPLKLRRYVAVKVYKHIFKIINPWKCLVLKWNKSYWEVCCLYKIIQSKEIKLFNIIFEFLWQILHQQSNFSLAALSRNSHNFKTDKYDLHKLDSGPSQDVTLTKDDALLYYKFVLNYFVFLNMSSLITRNFHWNLNI